MRRIGKILDARDLGLQIINEQMKHLLKMREVANTDEFLAIANEMEAISRNGHSAGGGTPCLGDKVFTFSYYMSGLERWTDERYTGAVFALKQLLPDEEKMNEFKDMYNRDHVFTWEFEDDYKIMAYLYCYEKSDTAECRKVQVGVKMVEQPIYRYDCVVPEGNAGELPAPILSLEL